jgi:site-specific DNA recombinase
MSSAAVYIRVSDEQQVKGHSLDFQLTDCVAQARGDGFLVEEERIYRDEGFSATEAMKRPAFQRMVADAKAGQFRRIYVWKWDRFARNRTDAVLYKSLLRRDLGVEIVSVKDPIEDPNSPSGYLLEGMTEVVAGWYSLDLSQKVSRSRQRRAELGLYNGGLPFGYAADPRSVKGNPLPPVIVETEAELVRMAYERYAGGATSMQEIAQSINMTGAVTRNTRKDETKGLTGPRPWGKESVKDVLGNPFYRGVVVYKGIESAGLHEAIVTPELWQKVETARKQRRGAGAVYTPAYRRYQLKGLARCVSCGERLWSNGTKRGAYYRDPAQLRGIDCLGGSIRVDELDRQMDGIIGRLVLPANWKQEIAILAGQDAEESIEAKRDRLEAKRRRLVRMYADDLISDAEYATGKLELDALTSSLLSAPERDTFNAAAYLENLGALWAQMDDGEKWEALQAMLEAVYVNLQTKRLVGIRAKPAFRQVFLLCAGSNVCEWRPGGDAGHQDTNDLERWQAFEVAS